MNREKALEFNHGLMEPNIKVNGITIKLQGKGNFITPVVTYMKENSKMIKQMDMVYLFMKKHLLNMKVTGKMICNMAQGYKFILIKIDMKECTRKVENMEKEHITLKMVQSTKVNGLLVKFKDMVYVLGLMVVDMRDNGQQTKGMEKVNFIGQMVVFIWESTKMIKDMERVHINGVMVGSM